MPYLRFPPRGRYVFHFRLDRARRWRFFVEIDSSGPVEVRLFHDLAAFRQESAAEGGEPAFRQRGKGSFTGVFGDALDGGTWIVEILSLSSNHEHVITHAHAMRIL